MNITQMSDLLEKTAAHIELLEIENNNLKKQLDERINKVETLSKEASYFDNVGKYPEETLGEPSSYTPMSNTSSSDKLENFLNNI